MPFHESSPSHVSPRQYRFQNFVFDLEGGFLRRDGHEVPLRPKAFDLLSYLVRHAGRLISKNELVEAVWPQAAVTDNSLSQCLFEIRRALDDDAQTMIRTVARRGYILDVPVSPVLPQPVREVRLDAPVFRPAIEAPPGRTPYSWIGAAAVVVAIAAAAVVSDRWWFGASRPSLTFTQLTDFTDSAMAPAVSTDGRMLAFLRSDSAFRSPDQIWLKLLPDGEPVQLTHLRGNKYGPAFSSNGLRVTFTMSGRNVGWETYSVPVVGGQEAQLMLPNAAGLSWIDSDHILFSEIKSGMHMGIVTSRSNRSDRREVYFPQHERAMAHYSQFSPDRRSVLVVEMNDVDAWQPCRLVPFEGGGPGRMVGPDGACTSAAWSPDGRWMYFSVQIDGRNQLWRQRYPDGQPEALTSGPDDHEGVAVFPDGSLATSVGVSESEVWIRTAEGEHPVTSAGNAIPTVLQGLSSRPVFSRDGNYLYYLLRRGTLAPTTELWRFELSSGRSEAVLAGFAINEYDLSDDGGEVVFSVRPVGKPSELWIARVDRDHPPQRIAWSGEEAAHFGPDGEIVCRFSDGTANYVLAMNHDGSARHRLVSFPISTLQGMSWDRRWVLVFAPVTIAPGTVTAGSSRSPGDGNASFAVPVDGGAPRRICEGFCIAQWSPDGKRLYLTRGAPSRSEPAQTVMIPVETNRTLPNLPADGFRLSDLNLFPGARLLQGGSQTADLRVRGFSPSRDPATIAYVKTSVHHNLFQIHLH